MRRANAPHYGTKRRPCREASYHSTPNTVYCTFVHIVANVSNTIKEGVNNILLVHGEAQRRRSSEDVVLVDRRLCVRSE